MTRVQAEQPARAARWATPVAVAWLVAVAALYLAPALARGWQLGPFDMLGAWGLGSVPGASPHNVVDSDQIAQMMPWTAVVWHQVHAGHLPLWNPYNGLGLPLAFNFQSAPFGLPALVGYLVPVRFAYTAAVVVKLLVGGTGLLFLCRVLGLSNLAGAFAGTVFETSGAFTAWLGWPQTGVLCWLGWVLGAGLLVIGRRRPVRDVVLLAVLVSVAAYGGHPESFAILLLVLFVFAAVVVATGLASPAWRPRALLAGRDLGLAVFAGLALSAPLLLPGAQLVSRTARLSASGYRALPPTGIVDTLFAGFHGLPVSGRVYFGPANYYDMAAYVGVAAACLAILGLLAAWRDVRVSALAAVAVTTLAVVYFQPVATLVDNVPVATGLLWHRALVPFDMAIAALGGVGLDTIRRRGLEPAVLRRLGSLTGLAGACLLAVWIAHGHHHLPSREAAEQAKTFIWPAVEVGVAIAATVGLALVARRGSLHRARRNEGQMAREAVCLAFLAVAVLFGVWVAPARALWSSGSHWFAATPAEKTLEQIVGPRRVGFGSCPTLTQLPSLGILPDANSAYGVSELSVYDTIVPSSYFRSWAGVTGQVATGTTQGFFCPSITTAALARQYGVSYVLEPQGAPGPTGTSRVATIGGEGLFAVPGGGVLSLTPAGAPADGVDSQALNSLGANPSDMHVGLDAGGPSVLYLHITNLPGWTATLDGKPLGLHSWATAMLQAQIPPGRHVLVVRYRPAAFEAGLIVAGLAVLGLTAAVTAPLLRRRLGRPGRGWASRAGPNG